MDKKPALLLSLSITLLVALNFYLIPISKETSQTAIVTRIIDGDTFETSDDKTIRLNNINTPERGEPGYEEAKSFLSLYLNSSVEIDEQGLDKYRRTLGKIYTPEYLNLEIVNAGFAKKFLVEDNEAELFFNAEIKAIESEKGLWEKSVYFDCIHSNIQNNIIMLFNKCSINTKEWTLEHEGRNKYKFLPSAFEELNVHLTSGEDNSIDLFWEDNGWNDERDTLYIFDEKHNLVHYNPDGY